MTLRRAFQLMALVSMLGIVALWIVAASGLIWVPGLESLLSACAMCFGLGVGGMACMTAWERGKHRRLMISGAAAGAVAVIGWIITIHAYQSSGAYTTASVWVLTPLSGWFALMTYLAAMSGARLRQGWACWSRRVAMVGATLFVFHIVVSVVRYAELAAADVGYLEMRDFREVVFAIGGGLGAVAVFGLALVSIVSVLARVEHEDVPRHERLAVPLTCPRCGTRQTLLSDGDACARCRLRIKVAPT